MFDFQRQHPVAAVSKTFREIRQNIISILVTLFVGASSEAIPFHLLVYIGVPLLFVFGILSWFRFQYKIENGELHIKSGIFVRKNLFLTKDRVQVIDISSGVIQRMFGLVRVDIQTAGSTSRDASLEAVTFDHAKEVYHLLRDDDQATESEKAEANTGKKVKKFILPGKDLLIAASTSGRFGIILSVMGTVFSQIEPVIRESEIFDHLFSLLPSQTDSVMIITIIILFIVVAWLFSFFSTLFMYGDFGVEVKNDELIISRGIFEKKRITVPYNRIQAIYVNEGVLRQPLGYASVHLESAGYGDDKGSGSLMLFPLIARKKLARLLSELVPEHHNEIEGFRPPFRSLRRYIFRSAFVVTAITAAVHLFFYSAGWIWLFPVLSILWGWLKYRDTGISWNSDTLILRNRTISKTTAIIKRKRVQDISITQSPIQRFRNLVTIEINVASGDHGKSFTVQDMEFQDGEVLLKVLQKQNLEQFDGVFEPHRPVEVSLPGWSVNVQG